jgi:hypothetical protein
VRAVNEEAEKEKAEKEKRTKLAERAYLQSASKDRAEIERQVLCGKKTPDQAEEWLTKRNAVGNRRLNLPSFASKHDLARFDPMKQAYWTLAMTAAWIIWRTPDAVLRYSSDYLFECKEWRPRREILAGKRIPAGGRIREGWEHRRCKLVSLHDVVHEASESDPAKMDLGPIEAANDLWAKFTSGKVEATGIQSNLVSSDRRRIVITRHEWTDLSWQHLHDGGHGSVANHGDSGPRYDDVRVPREHVCEIWKAAAVTSAPLPQHPIDAEESVETQESFSPHPNDETSHTTPTIETTKPVEMRTEPGPTDRETQATRTNLSRLQARVREIVNTLWPEGNLPARVADRDNSIRAEFASCGETSPSSRTIRRALKEDNSGQ